MVCQQSPPVRHSRPCSKSSMSCLRAGLVREEKVVYLSPTFSAASGRTAWAMIFHLYNLHWVYVQPDSCRLHCLNSSSRGASTFTSKRVVKASSFCRASGAKQKNNAHPADHKPFSACPPFAGESSALDAFHSSPGISTMNDTTSHHLGSEVVLKPEACWLGHYK
jgi:hypothetical protein